jgi:mRNA interferase RelE/StbE
LKASSAAAAGELLLSAACWRVEFDRDAAELRKLGEPARRIILRYLRERIATAEDPRRLGKPLAGESVGLWRYRAGDYLLVVTFEDDRLIVLVLRVAHRREVYD